MDPAVKAVQDRVLVEMLGSIKDTTGGGWKVLILDAFTTRVLSSNLKMSDIQDCYVSVVEDLNKRREPMPLAAVYFITPTSNSIGRMLEDFSSGTPLYNSVHVFFSSKVPSNELSKIKSCAPLIKVIKTLKESNLEFLTVDGRTISTEHYDAPVLLLGDMADLAVREAEAELDSITTRLATVMASLNEFPVVRFRKGKPAEAGDPPGAAARATLTHRVGQRLLQKLDVMQQQGQLPAKETCDLLIMDRSYDAVVPFIHEWTYECMVYDLLPVEANTYKYKMDSGETKEARLDENDNLWVEIRHAFMGDVYRTLPARVKEIESKNKVAKLAGGMGTGELSTRHMKQLITALPQYREILNKLSTHIQISHEVRDVTNAHMLNALGELEQDLVLGEKNSKDMLEFLAANAQTLSALDKVRLLCCYCATHPEKLDPAKLATWAKTARLSQADMLLVTNLALLGVPVLKSDKPEARSGSSFFGGKKAAKPDLLRRPKHQEEDNYYVLNRFEPLLTDILTDLSTNRLPSDQFPYVRPPAPDSNVGGAGAAQSARTGRPAGLTWTRRTPQGGEGSGQGGASRRLLVFLIGGAARSEMRVAHEVSKSAGRDVILVTTSVETPYTFAEHLRQMNSSGTMYGA